MAKEFPTLVEGPFINGLRPDKRVPVNAPYLQTCKYLRPTAFGLVTPETISLPTTGYTPSYDWPFPQLIRGQEHTLIGDATALRLVDETATPWTVAAVTTYDADSIATPKAITKGGCWHLADFKDIYFLTNGGDLIINSPYFSAVALQDDPSFNTVANSNGRLFMGGISFAGSPNAKFTTMAERWIEKASEQFVTYTGLSYTGGNVLYWSRMVGGETYSPFSIIIAALGFASATDYDKIDEDVLAAIERAEFGALPMEWQGDIQIVKQLGTYTMVYGDDGVTAVAPNFTYVDTLDFGVPGRGAVGGDKKSHLVIDSQGVLWKIDSKLQVSRLGYEEYISTLTLADTVISYDSGYNEFWISDGSATYILTPKGLGEGGCYPSYLNRCADGLVGVVEAAGDQTTLEVVSQPFNLGVRDYKGVSVVETDMRSITSPRVGVDYRHDLDTAFVTPTGVPGSPEGQFHPRFTGTDLRLRITGTRTADTKIQSATVRYQYVSNTTVRGPRTAAG
jgi:hypothetical protein